LFQGDESLRYGLVLGSVVPDLDFVPLAAVYLFNPTLARSFHRSASHSLLLPLGVLVISTMLYLFTKRRAVLGWGIGLAIGLALHLLLDVLFWFDQVQILWPVDIWGISTTVDLWRNHMPPEIVVLLVGPAAEFLFYGLFFYFLRRRALHHQIDTNLTPGLAKLELLLYFVFAVYVVLAFRLPRSTYEEVVYSVTAILFGPLTLYLLWRMRRTIVGSVE
jgi:membrane-bound metal-dependent hydrolase YbcI (DUF457 family)